MVWLVDLRGFDPLTNCTPSSPIGRTILVVCTVRKVHLASFPIWRIWGKQSLYTILYRPQELPTHAGQGQDQGGRAVDKRSIFIWHFISFGKAWISCEQLISKHIGMRSEALKAQTQHEDSPFTNRTLNGSTALMITSKARRSSDKGKLQNCCEPANSTTEQHENSSERSWSSFRRKGDSVQTDRMPEDVHDCGRWRCQWGGCGHAGSVQSALASRNVWGRVSANPRPFLGRRRNLPCSWKLTEAGQRQHRQREYYDCDLQERVWLPQAPHQRMA